MILEVVRVSFEVNFSFLVCLPVNMFKGVKFLQKLCGSVGGGV